MMVFASLPFSATMADSWCSGYVQLAYFQYQHLDYDDIDIARNIFRSRELPINTRPVEGNSVPLPDFHDS